MTAESKMFSIYADGVVPGFQRKTRIRLHAVVDFRNATGRAGVKSEKIWKL